MSNVIKHFFICLLAICISSFVKCLSKSLDHLKNVSCLFITELQKFFIYFVFRQTYVTNIFYQVVVCLIIF